MDISIGKFTLESLTLGMYLSPKVLYREYIQNSIDSIDDAVSSGIISREKARILIEIDKKQKTIVIKDNGMGIPASHAPKLLLDIGNSEKSIYGNRGFRGIGRLVGLGCSKKLAFKTSFKGEDIATVIEFDGLKLAELLTPGRYEEYDMLGVLEQVVTINKVNEYKENHYFEVALHEVENQDGILDKDLMSDYISQIAPLPYDPDRFSWAGKIHAAFAQKDLELEEYNIYIKNVGEAEKKLFKLYSDDFLTGKQRKLWDYIKDVQIKQIHNSNGEIIALTWYGISNLLGTISDQNIKGLRLRKGNILVGDNTTLNKIFKEERFNGWFQGEVFVLDKFILPNSRRDDFERNQNYEYLMEKLIAIGHELSKTIRDISSERNKEKNKDTIVLADLPKAEKISKNEDSNLNSIEKLYNKENDAFKKMSILINPQSEQKHTKYDILNVCFKITVSEKKILEKVFDIIKEMCPNNFDKIISEIMNRLKIT